jgi:uncharacterized protein (TIGR00297 family)
MMRAWLSPAGTLSAAAIGAAVWLGAGWRGVALLIAFFVTSSWLTPGGGRRGAAQVFANGGVAAGCALLAQWHVAFGAAFAGALAAAAADTWSTEIGARSRRAPRLITTWQTVAPGVSGGITPLGSAGALAGAGAIAAAALALHLVATREFWWVAAGGILGSLADSLLGASVQGRWRCDRCGALIETRRHDCGGSGIAERGVAWLNNDAVNLAATLVGAAVAMLPDILRRVPVG